MTDGSGAKDTPDSLHEQANSCRRLANDARTRSGKSSLRALADHFDGMANKMEADAEVTRKGGEGDPQG